MYSGSRGFGLGRYRRYPIRYSKHGWVYTNKVRVRVRIMSIPDDFFEIACHIAFSSCMYSSDEENKAYERPLKQRKPNTDRESAVRHEFLMKDYFNTPCIYSEEQFARRYRMAKPLVLRIMEVLKQNNAYFQQRPDCTGKTRPFH